MLSIGLGLVISFLCVLLGLYGMIYYHAVAWLAVLGLSASLGFTLGVWLKTEGYPRRTRIGFSVLLSIIVLVFGSCLILFVPPDPPSTDKKVEQHIASIPLTLRLDLLTLFPIDVAPHTNAFVLLMHHKKDEKDWGMGDISNHGEVPRTWPRPSEFEWRSPTQIEWTMAIDLKNESTSNLVNVQCMITFDFLEAIKSGTSTGSGRLVRTINHMVNIPRIPALSGIKIYFINQSPNHFMDVHFPNEASLLVVGETDRRKTKIIKTGTHWIETFDKHPLIPSSVRWKGSGID